MKSKTVMSFENRIDQLRSELYRVIEQEHLDSSIVQNLSRELDTLINLYNRYQNLSKSESV